MNTLTKYNPMGRSIFDTVFGNSDSIFSHVFGDGLSTFNNSYQTGDTVRFSETAENYTVEVDLPGVTKDQVELRVLENTSVFIVAKRTVKEKTGTTDRSITRSFTIAKDADASKLDATMHDGVLVITIPRRNIEAQNVRIVKIK